MSQKQFPDLFEADSLVNVSDDPELLARYLDECQGELAHFARLLGRFREAATIERERLERQYGSETLSAWNMIGLDRDKYVTSVFLCAPNDIRADTGGGFEGLDQRHGTSSKQPAPNVQRDGKFTIGAVFAGLSPYNKRPMPGFSRWLGYSARPAELTGRAPLIQDA